MIYFRWVFFMYAKVIIEYSVKSLDKVFVYQIPKHLLDKIKVGMKVIVPFGNQEVVGFVLEIIDNLDDNSFEVKEIKDIKDPELVLNRELLELGKYIKDSTMCSLIAAYQAMLPAGFKVKKSSQTYDKYDEYVSLINKDVALEYMSNYPRRTAHAKVINELLKIDRILKKEFNAKAIKELKEEKIINVEKVQKYRINVEEKNVEKELTLEQENVYSEIASNLNEFNTYLLHGVTGSGKTEIYIKLIKKVISSNKYAIMLVPEISLTTQIAKRFYESFGSNVAILHSALSNGEKYDEYLKILRGEVKVVVGTRSAVFAPLKDIGIIILDEEDSNSYKQDNNPRYHARDIAIFRAKYHNVPVVLGSATPSLETKARADKGVYKSLTLDKRVGKAIMPNIHIVNMEEEMKKRNLIFSDLLKAKILEKLKRKEQVILLLNRRGFSTFITCSNCGYTYKCPNCDITLTYHKSSNNLICHYCGYQQKKDELCPKCMEKALNYYGLGTEKLEESINSLFPQARVVRMDQDTTRNKGSHEKIINAFKNEEYDILLGTQMISKGLDFPKVTLVGVINADTTLNIPDYRSSENTFSLLSQVAGRSGRSEIPGEVIIQTFNPDNYVLSCVKENDYNKFYHYEMNFRHKLKYPPYYYLVSLKVIGKDYEETLECSKKVKKYLDENLEKELIVLGPTTSSVFKFNNEYRMQIIIKYKKEYNLKKVLKEIDEMLVLNKKMRLEIDFNPLKI